MRPVQLRVQGKIEPDGHLRLDVTTSLPAGDADVVLSITPSNGSNSRYDFSNLAGRLAWRGEAVAEQRGMRDEW